MPRLRRPGGTTAGPSPFKNRRKLEVLNYLIHTLFGRNNPHEQALIRAPRLLADFFASLGTRRLAASGQAQPKGRLKMLLTRRIDVLAIFASFAFIGAILVGMI